MVLKRNLEATRILADRGFLCGVSALAFAAGLALPQHASAANTTISADTTISSAVLGAQVVGVSISQISVTGSGTISGAATGILIDSLGNVGTLSNSGLLSGNSRGVKVLGHAGTISNQGTIIAVAGGGAAGGIANNYGTIDTIINSGTIISGASSAIGINQGSSSIGQIINSGKLIAATGGIYTQGVLGTLSNTGDIAGGQGISINGGYVGLIDNAGTIRSTLGSGNAWGIYLGGTLGTLNNSGTLSGVTALKITSGGNLGSFTNSGVISGKITNLSANALTIVGGIGATIGTLTGTAGKGTITNTLSNLVFSSGNLLLNDNIVATGRTVSNTANLTLNSIINVTGAFNQTSGSLEIDPTTAGLIVSGTAAITGGTVASNFESTGNYLAGTYTLVSGSSLNLSGATVTIGTMTALDRTYNTTGTALQLTINNDYVGGSLGTLNNSAALTSAATGLYVATTGSIGAVSNTGTLGGAQFGVNNRGTIGTMSNSGMITNANFTALWNQGSIGQLVNTGTITNSSWAILNSATIGTITNSGVIAGGGNAIQNNGVITVLDNSGTMSGGSNVIAGNFSTIINSGLIKGHINKDSGGAIGTIIGGSGGTVGTFTGSDGVSQGTIGASANLTFASGALLLNDTIKAVGAAASSITVSNTGADITLSTIVNVDANFSQSAGSLNLGNSGGLVVSQVANFTGGTIVTGANGFSSNATYLKGDTGGTLVSGGVGSSYTGVSIVPVGGISGLSFGSATSGTNLVLSANNIYVGDTQASISNSGSISGGVTWAAYVANTGSIGAFTNSGTLTGLNDGLSTSGSIGSLSNSGLISGGQKGLGNQNTITNLTNTSIGTILGGTAAGLQNDTSMGTVTNAGLISSGSAGFANYGTLGLLNNSGSINGGPQGIYLDGNSNSGTINNSGTITSGQSAVQVSGTLGSLINSGYIGNATNAINIAGSLTTLVNQSGGTLSGNNVIYISGTLGGLSNSGVIKGRIDNQTANNLTITGGTGATIGTLTGTSGIGTINNTLSNLTFASGNLLLNDRIIATGRTVSNTGANLSLDSNISITGAFSQTGGTINLVPGTSGLIVSGAANITGGTIAAGLSSTGNYLQSNYTLVSASSLNLAGATISVGTVTGLASSASTGATQLLLAIANDYVGGSLGTLNNSAAITSAATGLYVATTGSVGTVSNSGTLGGAQFGVNNRGTIGTMSNSGMITNANFTALWNQGSIGQLVNSGTITNSSWAILNSGTIGTITNSGVINGAGVGIQNNGVVTVLNNSGTLIGQSAVAGTFGTIINGGLIRGNINPSGGVVGTIIGGGGTLTGTFTGSSGTMQGTIGASGNLTFATGAVLLNDTIKAVGAAASSITVSNTGANITLSTIVNVDANFNQTGGTLDLGSTGRLVVTQAANFSGGTVAVDLDSITSTANYLAGDTVGDPLVTGGVGSSYTGVSIAATGGITGLTTGAGTSGTNLVVSALNYYVGASLTSLSNSDSISGPNPALYVAATGSIGTVTNSGGLNGYLFGVENNGSIGTLSNSGLISGSSNAILNNGSIGQLANSGTIIGGGRAILNYGTADTISNSGTMTAAFGVMNAGTVTQLDNSGNLSGNFGVYVTSIGSLAGLSNSGTLSGSFGAIYNEGVLGPITNTGIIAGDIINMTVQDLSISGGMLTGYAPGTQGTITNAQGDVVLGGTIALNDAIYVGSNTVINNGGSLSLASIVNVTGDFSQSSGLLTLDSGAMLSVSGAAVFSGGTIAAADPGTGNYLVGGSGGTLVDGGTGSDYSGVIVMSDGRPGLTQGGQTIGDDLVVAYLNDYIGGSLGTLSNTGSISAATAVYIASTGNLGNLNNSGTLSGSIAAIHNEGVLGPITNSGVIAGNIDNLSVQDLSISGGTLTGYAANTQGTITNTLGNVVLGGTIALNDAINVGSNTVINNGGSLSLASTVNVTGDFSQSSGLLTLAYGTQLAVSGAASMTGGTVSTSVAAGTNYLVGDTVGDALVTGGVGSSYSGVTVELGGGINGLAVTAGTSGTNLVANALNDYIGADLGTLSNTGSLSAATAVYIASTGTLGSLDNSGTLSGSIAAIHNEGVLGPITNTGVIAGNIDNFSAQDLSISGGSENAFGTLTGYAEGTQGLITNTGGNLLLTGNILLNSAINVGSNSVMVDGGSLALNDAVHITGNYSQTGGKLVIGVTSTAAYGKLVVSGSASLTGTDVTLVKLGTHNVAAGEAYTIVEANGELTYSNLTSSTSGLNGDFSTVASNGATGLVLTLSSTAPQLPMFTQTGIQAGGAGVGTGAALDAIADSGSEAAIPVITNVLLPLAVLPTDQQQRAIIQLAPTQLTPQVIAVAVSPAVNAIVQHQEVLAANLGGREERGLAAGSQGQRGNVWGQFLVSTANREDVPAASAYKANVYGVLVGADLVQTSTLAAGGSLSWVSGTARGSSVLAGSSTSFNTFQGAGYFTWAPRGFGNAGIVFDGQLGVGFSRYNQLRQISFLGATARAKYNGQQYYGNLRASYSLPLGKKASLTPYASIREVHFHNGSYAETGAADANLQVAGQSVDTLSHEIGFEAAKILETESGRIAPSLKLGWTHTYNGDPIAIGATLGGIAFNSQSARIKQDGLIVGAGISFMRTDRVSIGLQYDGDLRRDFQSHSGTIKLKLSL